MEPAVAACSLDGALFILLMEHDLKFELERSMPQAIALTANTVDSNDVKRTWTCCG